MAKIVKPEANAPELVYQREFRAFRNAAWPMAPIPPLYSVQETALALAQIVGRVGTSDGRHGRRLTDLVGPDGLDQVHLTALKALVARVFDARLAAFDFKPDNLVYGLRWPGDVPQFVIIDGFGDTEPFSRTELPWPRARRKLGKHLVKIAKCTPLRFDARALRFRNPT